MTNDSPRCRSFVLLLLLHMCVFVVADVVACVFLECCCCCMHVSLSCGCVLLGLCVCGVSFFIS